MGKSQLDNLKEDDLIRSQIFLRPLGTLSKQNEVCIVGLKSAAALSEAAAPATYEKKRVKKIEKVTNCVNVTY